MAAAKACIVGLGLLALSASARAQTIFNTDAGSPYGGSAWNVPGTIQGEHYDIGGQGVGYSDSTPGNLMQGDNAYRPDEDVDIGSISLVGQICCYKVNYIAAGEYLRYTLNVRESVDAFDFIFRVSSIDDSGSFRIVSGGNSCDDYGTDLSGLVEVPNTGAWSTFVDIQITGTGSGGLPAGSAQIWLCAVSTSFEIDYFTMMKSATTCPTPTPTPSPLDLGGAYLGVPATVPGIIEAEKFDEGGECVAYHDTTEENIPGHFRPEEEVDINVMDGGGYDVGYWAAGEYLRYTIDVTENVDVASFSFRVASEDGLGSFRIVTGGYECNTYTTDLSGLVSVPSTGANDDYEEFNVSGGGDGGLKIGDKHIWLCAVSRGFAIDSFSISGTATCSAVECSA
eukprot:jgi/Undpi1/10938/HiC_scaffold_3.g01464.m1